jgi:hypothetical protein
MSYTRIASLQSLLIAQYGGVEDERGVEWLISNNPRSRTEILFSGDDVLCAVEVAISQPIGRLKSPDAAAQVSPARSLFLPRFIPIGAIKSILRALEDTTLCRISHHVRTPRNMGFII